MNQPIDVAVIGAGPAGLAAAAKAKEGGAEKVTVIERSDAPGGLLDQCIHNGFGLSYFGEDLTGPQFSQRFIEKAKDLDVDLLLDTMVLNLTQDKKVTACNRAGLSEFQAKSVILAMGCRERTREALMIPGSRPSGVLTAGAAQRYVNVDGFLPGKEIVILGSGDVGMIMARRLSLEGAHVKAVVEILPYVGGLIRNEVQCLNDFDIPLYLSHTITEILGKERVQAVKVAQVDADWNPIVETERLIDCDTLLISAGLIPENELSRKAGVEINPVTGGPFVDEKRETNIPGIFAAGNVAHVHDMVDNVALEGEIAGLYAGEYSAGGGKAERGKIQVAAGENVRYIIPNSISGEEDVELYLRVSRPVEKPVIKGNDIFKKKLRVAKPSEMIKISLTKDDFKDASIGPGDKLSVWCERRNAK